MPESQAAPAVEGRDSGLNETRPTAREGTAGLAARRRPAAPGGRPVRWGFVVVTVGLGGYAVAGGVDRRPGRAGQPGAGPVAAALLAVLARAHRHHAGLAGAAGRPGVTAAARAAARIMFIGQLGKYLPGSVWPILAQMELGNASGCHGTGRPAPRCSPC